MKVSLEQAIKYFYPSSSLELVFFEAVTNALDAKAKHVEIIIDIESLKKVESLVIAIKDDGEGFTDKNFAKFEKLLSTDNASHKGVGRLVFLEYFDKVEIESCFDGKKRSFVFSESFNGKSTVVDAHEEKNGSVFTFRSYSKTKLRAYEYLAPDKIIQSVVRHLLPVLYTIKMNNEEFILDVTLNIRERTTAMSFDGGHRQFSVEALPPLKEFQITSEQLDFFQKIECLYCIRDSQPATTLIIGACSDNRTILVPGIIEKSRIPDGYEVIILFKSDYFTGKTDSTRQLLALTESEMTHLKFIVEESVSTLLRQEIPSIKESNKRVAKEFSEKYPHLQGYYDKNTVGLIDIDRTVDSAQRKFISDQKQILNAETIDDVTYEKTLEVSSRVLMSYILYRAKIIDRLQQMKKEDLEGDIHKLIIPTKVTLSVENKQEELFINNAWILDEKYMSYREILSEVEMSKLLEAIKVDGAPYDDTRPDISIVFSNDPDEAEKVDVVVVELKRLGVSLARKEEVASQLRQRARKLLQYYPNKIQRLWFYGIIDFDEEIITSITEDGYIPLFSAGKIFYKEQDIIPDNADRSKRVPAGIYLLDFHSLVKDAEIRNSTFLDILKSGFQKKYPIATLEQEM